GAIPSSPWLTLVLCLGFVGLLIYGVMTGNTLSFVMVAVVAVFIGVPYLLLVVLNGWRLPPRTFPPTGDRSASDQPAHNEARSDEDDEGGAPNEREPLDGQAPAASMGEPHTGNGRAVH
ncbi:MAG TPA: hypothetical protein VKQ36_04160, partial [Ktedonobacterales bacterium]|nr:hypothetical protein [Ktedonobacterales bacterium]